MIWWLIYAGGKKYDACEVTIDNSIANIPNDEAAKDSSHVQSSWNVNIDAMITRIARDISFWSIIIANLVVIIVINYYLSLFYRESHQQQLME